MGHLLVCVLVTAPGELVTTALEDILDICVAVSCQLLFLSVPVFSQFSVVSGCSARNYSIFWLGPKGSFNYPSSFKAVVTVQEPS